MRVLLLFAVYYGCAGYALLNPFFGVLFFAHITIFRPESLVWEELLFGRLHLITALATVVGYLIQRTGPARHGAHQRFNAIVFAVFVGWLWVVSLNSNVSVDVSVERTLYITKILVFCILLNLTMTSPYRIRRYVLVSSASFGLVSLWAALQGLAGNWRLEDVWLGGSNGLAAALALMIPFTLSAALDPTFPRWQRIGFGTCIPTMIVCMMYTNSRGGFVGFVTGVLGLVLLARQKGRLLVIVLTVMLLVYPLIPADYSERLATIAQEDEDTDLSAAGRPVLWRLAFRMWQDQPFLGVGLGNFSLVVDSYEGKARDLVTSREMARVIFGNRREPHSLYLGMLAESGAIGLGLFLVLLLRNMFWRLGSDENALGLVGKGAQAGVLGFSVAALFGDFQYIDMVYWQLFLIGAIASSAEVAHGTPRPGPLALSAGAKTESQ